MTTEIALWKIQKSIGTPIPKLRTHSGLCGFIPSHSLTLPRVIEWGLGWVTSMSIIHTDLHKLNNKKIWCTDKSRTYTKSQNSSWLTLRGSHKFLSYSILYDWPHSLHSNVIFPETLKSKVLKLSKLGLPPFWKPIIFLCKFLIEIIFKEKL